MKYDPIGQRNDILGLASIVRVDFRFSEVILRNLQTQLILRIEIYERGLNRVLG